MSAQQQPVRCETVAGSRYALTGVLDRETVPAFWSERDNWLPKEAEFTFVLSGLERIDSAGMAMYSISDNMPMNKNIS